MVAVAENLTLAEFESRFEKGDISYEFWYGCAIPKGMATWLHGILQRIVMELLTEADYEAGSEVELRIEPDARPKPDLIATKDELEEPYPTRPVEVVVEILSPDDTLPAISEKCRIYCSWGFAEIYVVDPKSRSLSRWTNNSLQESDHLTTVPASEIWKRLDRRNSQLALSRMRLPRCLSFSLPITFR